MIERRNARAGAILLTLLSLAAGCVRMPPGTTSGPATLIAVATSAGATISQPAPPYPTLTQSFLPEFEVISLNNSRRLQEVARVRTEGVRDIAWAPSGSEFSALLLRSAPGALELAAFEPHTLKKTRSLELRDVHSIAYSPDQSMIALLRTPPTISLVNIEGEPVDDFPESGACRPGFAGVAMSYSQDGDTAIALFNLPELEYSGIVYRWSALSGECLGHALTLGGHTRAAVFSHDGRYLAAVLGTGRGSGAILEVWELDTGRELCSFGTAASAVALSSDAQRLAAYDLSGGKIVVLETTGCSWIAQLDAGEGVIALALSPDGGLVASGREAIDIWDGTSGAHVAQIQGLEAEEFDEFQFSPDGRLLLVVSHGEGASYISLWGVPGQ